MKIPSFGLDTDVGPGSHAATPSYPHFALLAMVETPVTPPTVGAQSSNPLWTMRPLHRSVHRSARSTMSQHHQQIVYFYKTSTHVYI